ncbi:hypothetical protein [Pseudoalteromonas rubra]|uniref:hypothetical protein n=1 Tax=Pseudoalteromonas rubra TaxID=43658 RepID=UPI0012DC775E|nr:hypothetical protein [Pseudoalteromonas rubra]
MKLRTLSYKAIPSKLLGSVYGAVTGGGDRGGDPTQASKVKQTSRYTNSDDRGKNLLCEFEAARISGGNGSGNDPTKPYRRAIKVTDLGSSGG